MADETVNITINTKANTQGIQKVTADFGKLREMGEKVSNIGLKLSAALTAPIVGIGALVLKNEELQKSLKPIQDAFGKIFNDLAIGFIPVVRDLTPAILDIARSIGDLVTKFNSLSTGQKETILKFVLFAAAIGPVIAIVGQVMGFVGTVGVVFQTLGGGLATATPAVAGFGTTMMASFGPLIPLLTAIAGLIALINSEFGQSGITAGKQLLSMGTAGIFTALYGQKVGNTVFMGANKLLGLTGKAAGGLVSGGRPYMVGERGPEMFVPGSSGTIVPNHAVGGGSLQIVYAPQISTASQYEAEQILKPMIENIQRQRNK